MKSIEIYDCTLRDGTQAEDFNLSVEDKIRIAQKLDELGIAYIEGGWPGSNPKDVEFFQGHERGLLKTGPPFSLWQHPQPQNPTGERP